MKFFKRRVTYKSAHVEPHLILLSLFPVFLSLFLFLYLFLFIISISISYRFLPFIFSSCPEIFYYIPLTSFDLIRYLPFYVITPQLIYPNYLYLYHYLYLYC